LVYTRNVSGDKTKKYWGNVVGEDTNDGEKVLGEMLLVNYSLAKQEKPTTVKRRYGADLHALKGHNNCCGLNK
jgi:hypothetical protein